MMLKKYYIYNKKFLYLEALLTYTYDFSDSNENISGKESAVVTNIGAVSAL